MNRYYNNGMTIMEVHFTTSENIVFQTLEKRSGTKESKMMEKYSKCRG